MAKASGTIDPTAMASMKQAKKASQTSGPAYKNLQARTILEDAARFKYEAEKRGLSVQDALVEAINSLLREWGEPPIRNPGANRSPD